MVSIYDSWSHVSFCLVIPTHRYFPFLSILVFFFIFPFPYFLCTVASVLACFSYHHDCKLVQTLNRDDAHLRIRYLSSWIFPNLFYWRDCYAAMINTCMRTSLQPGRRFQARNLSLLKPLFPVVPGHRLSKICQMKQWLPKGSSHICALHFRSH